MAKQRQTTKKKKTTAKPKTTRSRKKTVKVTKPDKNQILEYKDWKATDRCYTVFTGESKASLCDIIHFHPDDLIAPSVSLNEVSTGKYRVAPVAVISETANGAKELRPRLVDILSKHKKKQKLLQKLLKLLRRLKKNLLKL